MPPTLKPTFATTLAANAASIRVMEKLGLTLERHWLYKEQSPAVAYAITATQWRSRVKENFSKRANEARSD